MERRGGEGLEGKAEVIELLREVNESLDNTETNLK